MPTGSALSVSRILISQCTSYIKEYSLDKVPVFIYRSVVSDYSYLRVNYFEISEVWDDLDFEIS